MPLSAENSTLSREYAWDLCYRFFTQNQERLLQADCNEALLLEASVHLSAYLGFFGMLRGSSFLLKTNPSFFVPIIRDVWQQARASDYPPDSTHPDHVKPLWDTLNRSLLDASKDLRETSTTPVSHTLISKILLGMFACSPAYDTFVMRGLQAISWWTGLQTLQSSSDSKIDAWDKFINAKETEELLKEVKRQYALDESTPPCRVADLFLWDFGKMLDHWDHLDQEKPSAQPESTDKKTKSKEKLLYSEKIPNAVSAVEMVRAFRDSQKA